MNHSGINFALVKKCISFLAIPISHIANISFGMGIFPDRMKIAKVIPIFKSGLKDFLLIIDQFLYFYNFQRYWKNFLIIG